MHDLDALTEFAALFLHNEPALAISHSNVQERREDGTDTSAVSALSSVFESFFGPAVERFLSGFMSRNTVQGKKF